MQALAPINLAAISEHAQLQGCFDDWPTQKTDLVNALTALQDAIEMIDNLKVEFGLKRLLIRLI